jgi:sugar lactone lactonase YvrE
LDWALEGEANDAAPSGERRSRGEIELPVTNVTRATFGGKHLDELIVTTAWHASEAELSHQPLAGDLFSIRVAVPGSKR